MLVPFADRCPDGVVIRDGPGAALGIGRLCTTERQALPDSASPLSDIIAVVDGRLDDAEGLQAALGMPASASDADLVVAGYRKWDVDVVAHLCGDFALLIWDARSSRLVAARDPLGVRPLFHGQADGRMLFASDPEQLLAAGVPPVPDDRSVVEYLLWDFFDLERSCFRAIRRIAAGHVLVSSGSITMASDYRRPPPALRPSTRADEIDVAFRDAFSTAVRRRLRSTGSCVTHLSGGLDSSSIVCAADRLLSSEPSPCPEVVAAAALHPGLSCDEGPFIDAVANRIGLRVQRWDGTAALPDELCDGPLAWPGGRFPLTGGTEGDIAIARSIGSRVVLSGIGGDQLGIPDGALQDAVVERRWRDARRFVFEAPGADGRWIRSTLLRTMKALSPAWLREAHDRIRAVVAPPVRPPWLRESAWRDWRPRPRASALPGELTSHIRRRHWQTIVEPRHILGTEILQLHGMRNQVEFRFPFMDWDLVLFALSVPSSYWPAPWPQERLHRRPMAPLLPIEITNRRSKADFSSALANRVRRQLPTIRAIFASPDWASDRYVERADAVRALKVFERMPQPSFAETWAVWGTVTVEAWLKRLSRYTPAPKVEA
jgi:asparagine synthase (glutamine-hydrolysing)